MTHQRKKGTQQEAPTAPSLGASSKAWTGPSHSTKAPHLEQVKPDAGSPKPYEYIAPDLGQVSSNSSDLKDLDMAEPPNAPDSPKRIAQSEPKLLSNGAKAPRASLSFGMPGPASPQTLISEAKANPFASPGVERHGAELNNKPQADMTEGWTFKRRRRHAPKLAFPRQEPHQATPPPPYTHNS